MVVVVVKCVAVGMGRTAERRPRDVLLAVGWPKLTKPSNDACAEPWQHGPPRKNRPTPPPHDDYLHIIPTRSIGCESYATTTSCLICARKQLYSHVAANIVLARSIALPLPTPSIVCLRKGLKGGRRKAECEHCVADLRTLRFSFPPIHALPNACATYALS